MKEQSLNQTVDSILLPLLQTRDEAESQRLLEHLIADHILPVSKEIIYHKLRPHTDGQKQQDSEDVQNNVVLKLLSTLRECKHNPDFRSIGNFRSYVAVTTYNACNEYLRQRFPQRHSLKNQLRYLFTHFPQLAMWNKEDGKAVCGLMEMKEQNGVSTSQGEIISLASRAGSLGLNNQPLIDSVITILKLLPAPVELDDLVGLVAEAKGIKDEAAQSEGEEGESLLERMADAGPPVDRSVEQRLYLQRLWKEICELPLRQRLALLLNLKDEYGNSQVEMLPFTGVATMRQIAGVLEMSEEAFAELWNELPMEDAQIAERLNLTRQQIINLRKSARQRLAKKMRQSAF
jgi:RNA polymerase sigma factor (sigma-70 family)